MGEGKVQNKTNTGLKKAEALNYVGVSTSDGLSQKSSVTSTTYPVCSAVTAMGVSPGEERRDREHLTSFGLSDTKTSSGCKFELP